MKVLVMLTDHCILESRTDKSGVHPEKASEVSNAAFRTDFSFFGNKYKVQKSMRKVRNKVNFN